MLNSGLLMFEMYSRVYLSRVAMQRYSQEKVQIYRRTPMSKCDFNEVALQLYCYFTLHLFLGTPLGGYFCLSHLWGFNPRLQTVTL